MSLKYFMKNHLIVLPDADKEMASDDILASMSGCSGQRCMAASAMVGVGEIQEVIDKLVMKAKKMIPGENLGSVISKNALLRIKKYIDEAEKNGAKILLDGRRVNVKGKEKGYFIGPTIIDNVTPDMKKVQHLNRDIRDIDKPRNAKKFISSI